MLLRPFFSFYGSKWLIARKYPEPVHPVIIEPFAGSAGYSLRHYEREVRLYDKDPIIVGVWDYLIKASITDIRRLPATIQVIDHLPSWVPQEAKWLIGFWISKGQAAPRLSGSPWNITTIRPADGIVWGQRVKDRLIEQVPFIRHWKAIHTSYPRIPNVQATWFVDPPYQIGGEHYRIKLAYREYRHLAEWCLEREGQLIVCERDGADWLPFRPFVTSRSTLYEFGKEAIYMRGGA